MELANIFPSKYIKATDLQGREATVVIERAEIETLGDDRKLVLYFKGKEKGLVTNRTNADRIAHMYGTNTDMWIGQPVVLFCDMVNFQGRVVEAIRVRPPTRPAAPRAGNTVTTSPQRMNSQPLDVERGDPIPYSHDEQVPF